MVTEPAIARPDAAAATQRLEGLTRAATSARGKGPPPVHLWNPPFCGDIDMRIAGDGTWYYIGSPIGRAPLVQLFASILRKDEARYVLVTPVERVGIVVDDAPFLGVELDATGSGATQNLRLRTNVEDFVAIGPQNPLRFAPGASGGLKPYVLVRAKLEALVKRALFYQLVDLGQAQLVDSVEMFGVWSGGAFFPMAPMADIAGLT